MKISVTKLSFDTLVDIVQNVYPGTYEKQEHISKVGGSPRDEYYVSSGDGAQFAAVASSSRRAWEYAAEKVLKENNG